jgi:hypothetical protein
VTPAPALPIMPVPAPSTLHPRDGLFLSASPRLPVSATGADTGASNGTVAAGKGDASGAAAAAAAAADVAPGGDQDAA